MHWLTFIFGFLSIYCVAGFCTLLSQDGLASAHDALVIFGVGAVIFALASWLNQRRHRRAQSRTEAPKA